jgi:hypothetical protein
MFLNYFNILILKFKFKKIYYFNIFLNKKHCYLTRSPPKKWWGHSSMPVEEGQRRSKQDKQ